MTQQLDDLLQHCAVKLTISGRQGWGTGFFVAPGLILTCAHVVKNAMGVVKVRWQQQEDFAEARIEKIVLADDIALLQFEIPLEAAPPSVYLDESEQAVERGDELSFFGYPDEDFPNGCPVSSECEGLTGDQPPFIKFKLGQVRPGISGAALLNTRTGKVCGMVKFTRAAGFDLGGGGICVTTILEQFPQLRELQEQWHQQDNRWVLLLPRLDRTERNEHIPHNLPHTYVTFVGRSDELTQLRQQLQHSRAGVAISGMGGIGKTELALQYGYYGLKEEAYSGGICWLRAREADVGAQIVTFARSYLNLEPPESLAQDVKAQVDFCWRHWHEGEVLVILDDVTDYARIQNYLPPQETRFKVLLTTRLQYLLPEPLEIEVLSEAAALELLRSLMGDSSDRLEMEPDEAKQLCWQLGYLPLGLELVGRFLKRKPDYSLTRIQQRLERALADRPNGMTAQFGVTEAFELTWKEISEDAKNLCYLLGLFALAPIPWQLVEWCFPKMDAYDLEDLRDDALIEQSLLRRFGEQIYLLHPLIREFFKEKTDAAFITEIDDLKRSICSVMAGIARQIPATPTYDDITQFTPVIPHLEEVASNLIDFYCDEDLINAFTGVARFYKGQGLFQKAEFWYRRGVEVVQQRLGQNHLNFATSLNNLAAFCLLLGRYGEAERYCQQAIRIQEQSEPDQPKFATTLNNLAEAYRRQRRYREAEPLYLRSIQIREQHLEPNHRDLAESLNNLALLYQAQGDDENARSYYQRALEINKKQLGQDHPRVALSLNNLAAFYGTQGRYEEAELLCKQSLAIREKLGRNHPDVAESLNTLAKLYEKQGYYEKAESRYRRSLEIREQHLEQNHPATAQSLNDLATFYREQKRYEEAEVLFLRSLQIREQLEANHPNDATSLDVATSRGGLARLYLYQNRYHEAESFLLQALAIFEQKLAANHPKTVKAREYLQELRNAMKNGE